jgi:glycosyltransferase involved in cell wall biosynthesis
MRTALLTNMFSDLGGGELCLLDHVRHLRRRGVDVHVGLLASGPLEAELEAAGASCFVFPFNWQGSRWRSLRLIAQRVRDFAGEIRRRRVDVVISYTFNDFVLAGIAARLCGTPLVYRAQGELASPGGQLRPTWLGRWFKPVVAQLRPWIVCTTAGEARSLQAAGLPARRISHVFLGTRPAREPAESESAGSGEKSPVVALFGRLVRWKGQDVFIRALGILAGRGTAFEAWIVGSASFGDGEEYERQLRQLAADVGIADRVKFLGFRRDVPALMQMCDVVCHASHVEPFGMVVIEAMMAGKPVVASAVSGPMESVVDGQTGHLVPPGEPEKMANALATLLADPALRSSMGMAARQRAARLFDLDKNLEALDLECESALSAGRSPA